MIGIRYMAIECRRVDLYRPTVYIRRIMHVEMSIKKLKSIKLLSYNYSTFIFLPGTID